MSTTSLSSCDCCDYCPYSYVIEDCYDRPPDYQGPFYNTMGQPLVYYADVNPYYMRSSKGRRKGNRNCFAKAFEWYTQEREPHSRRQVSPELSGFAKWLDAKYGEYLRESEGNQSGSPPQPPPSTRDVGPCAPCAPCQTNEPSSAKRHSRMKSPWRKLRHQSRDGGDVPSKTPNGSCQFILQPKDLTRPASECYQTPASCPDKSNTTVISAGSGGTRKTIVKSQSMSSICNEKITTNRIEFITTQEGLENRQVDALKRNTTKTPQVPSKMQVACDQTCKIKQQSKDVATVQINPAKEQMTDITCDPKTCDQVCKPIGEVRLPAKSQKIVIPYDPNCCNPQRKDLGEVRLPVNLQNIEIPCDTNCCKLETKPLGEIRLSAKSQNIEISFDANCCNQERKPMGEIRMPVHAQKLDLPCNPNSFRQEYKSMEDKQRAFKNSQISDMPCDTKCINRHITEIRDTEMSQNYTIPCDPSSFKPDNKAGGVIQRVNTRSKIKDLPCKPSCIYKQDHTIDGQIEPRSKAPNEAIPCNPSCSMQEPTQVEQISCDTSYIYMHDMTKMQSYENTCMNKAASITAKETRAPLKTPVKEKPREGYKQEYKPTEVHQAHSKIQKSEVTCVCFPTKTESVVKKVPSKVRKIDVECQCPEEDTLPVDAQIQWEYSHQTYASTSTACQCIVATPLPPPIQIENNETVCKCIVEKALPPLPQVENKNTVCKCIVDKSLPSPIQLETNNTVCKCVAKNQPSTPIQVTMPCSQVTSNRTQSFTVKKRLSNEVSCNCIEDINIKFITPCCQCARYRFDSCCNCVIPNVQPPQEMPMSVCNAQRQESRTMMNYSSLAVRQITRSHTTFKTDGVQTSDHSISLDDVGHDYAFFMKIVCADKLNDCFCDSFTR